MRVRTIGVTVHRLAFVLAAAVAGLGCDAEPLEEGVALEDSADVWASIVCRQATSCDCASPPYESVAQCEDAIQSFMVRLRDDGEANNLRYNGLCMQRLLEDLQARECGRPSDPQPCHKPCNIFDGGLGPGALCEQFGPYMSDCAGGKTCNGVCDNPACVPFEAPERSGVVAAGEACTADTECGDLHECREGQCAPEDARACSDPLTL